jgi:beta-phosphoglucomutase
MLQAVIFDFDGVITDSEILHFRAFNAVLTPYGFQLTKPEYYKKYLGMSDADCFRALIAEGRLQVPPERVAGASARGVEGVPRVAGVPPARVEGVPPARVEGVPPARVEGVPPSNRGQACPQRSERDARDTALIKDLGQQKTRVFEKLARTEGRIIEGVREFLDTLSAAQVPTAICSGALRAEIELILEEAGLRSYFDVIVSAEEVQRGKPDPEGFLLALEKLNEVWPEPIAPGCCVVIEDSHWGLKAAQAAGMHTVAVTNTYDAAQLKQADRVVARLDELTMDDLQQICA